jgi:hypothetical protein
MARYTCVVDMPYNADGNGPEMDETKVVGIEYHVVVYPPDGFWSPPFKDKWLAERVAEWLEGFL